MYDQLNAIVLANELKSLLKLKIKKKCIFFA